MERAGADPVRERDAARRRRAFEVRQRAPGAPVGREDAVVIAPAGGVSAPAGTTVIPGKTRSSIRSRVQASRSREQRPRA